METSNSNFGIRLKVMNFFSLKLFISPLDLLKPTTVGWYPNFGLLTSCSNSVVLQNSFCWNILFRKQNLPFRKDRSPYLMKDYCTNWLMQSFESFYEKTIKLYPDHQTYWFTRKEERFNCVYKPIKLSDVEIL